MFPLRFFFFYFSSNFHNIFFLFLVGCTAPNSNSSIPCNGHGKCETKENGQSCMCYYGFTGPYCEHSECLTFIMIHLTLSLVMHGFHWNFFLFFILDLNDCLPNPCVNGLCLDGDGKFTCKCAPGWSGN